MKIKFDGLKVKIKQYLNEVELEFESYEEMVAFVSNIISFELEE